MNRVLHRLFILLLLAGIPLAACNSGSDSAGEATAPPATTTPAATDRPATAPAATVAAATAASEPTDEPAPTATAQTSPTEATEAMAEVEVNGRNPDGTYFRGRADAPVVLIDYSDFFWSTCRSYVLGPEKEIISNYVDNGQVKIIFWPVVDFGPGSMNAQAAADCIGRQDVAAFWQVHDRFFENQRELSSADDAYFAGIAESVGVDVAQFNECYSSGEAHGHITALDSQRREAGIRQRPTIDINGQQLFGAQPFTVFAEVIEAKLAGQ